MADTRTKCAQTVSCRTENRDIRITAQHQVGFVLLIAVACSASCKGRRGRPRDGAVVEPARDASEAQSGTDAGAWPELATLPSIEAVRVIPLPARLDAPRFTVGGPVLIGDLAVVSSSQFGFAAVDFRRGQLVWTKPSGNHVAPPIVVDRNVVLIGDCINPPEIPASETLLGCMRVVTPTGADQAYLAVHGATRIVEEFLGARGEQRVWLDAKTRMITWRRGEAAVEIDPLSGVAKRAAAEDPALAVSYKGASWDVRRTEEGLIEAKGKPAWRTERSYGRLLGAVYIPEHAPMIRAAGTIMHDGKPRIMIFDMDATGSLNGQVTLSPVPGIAVTAHAISTVGDAALAVRLDTSLERDYIAAYAANALLIYTYALPHVPRPDPIGIAIASDAVVVFHDGDTITVLPELSAPPTAPGAVRAPSENATP